MNLIFGWESLFSFFGCEVLKIWLNNKSQPILMLFIIIVKLLSNYQDIKLLWLIFLVGNFSLAYKRRPGVQEYKWNFYVVLNSYNNSTITEDECYRHDYPWTGSVPITQIHNDSMKALWLVRVNFVFHAQFCIPIIFFHECFTRYYWTEYIWKIVD